MAFLFFAIVFYLVFAYSQHILRFLLWTLSKYLMYRIKKQVKKQVEKENIYEKNGVEVKKGKFTDEGEYTDFEEVK
jgi:predicted membrane protein